MSSRIKITCKSENIEKILKNLNYCTNQPLTVTLEIENLEDNFKYLCGSGGDILEWKFENSSSGTDRKEDQDEEKTIYHPIPLEMFKNMAKDKEKLAIFLMAFWELYLSSPSVIFGSGTWRGMIETKINSLRFVDVPMNVRTLAEKVFNVMEGYHKVIDKYNYLSGCLQMIYKIKVVGDWRKFENLILEYNEN